jgi:hypothetical protein
MTQTPEGRHEFLSNLLSPLAAFRGRDEFFHSLLDFQNVSF